MTVGARRTWRRWWQAAACAGLLLPAAARAQDDFVKVIPPGSERVVQEMLAGEPGPAGCTFVGAAIDRTLVRARYQCGGPDQVTVELRHIGDDSGATAKTAKFALVPRGAVPEALVKAVAARVTEREGGWRWISAEAPGLATPSVGPTAASQPQGSLSPEESDAFVAAVKLYREARVREARDAFVAMARKNPRGGVLGMVVVTVAASRPDPETVASLAAAADQNPADPLPQFIAGVAAHYCGHTRGRTPAEKRAMYETAAKYLQRARPAYDFEPRTYVYLAVSHFRLGHQLEAERLIEQAIPLATNDPDVYYCRAEVFHRVNRKRAIADIETYVSMTEKLSAQGLGMNASKSQKVKTMLEHLQAAERGAKLPPDLFDPVASPATGPSLPWYYTSPAGFAACTAGAGLLVAVVWLALALARRRRGT
jgi:tetratricopeptide (TPR) repeat protein